MVLHVSMEGGGGGGGVFQMEGFIFKWGRGVGSIGFDREVSKKIIGWGGECLIYAMNS